MAEYQILEVAPLFKFLVDGNEINEVMASNNIHQLVTDIGAYFEAKTVKDGTLKAQTISQYMPPEMDIKSLMFFRKVFSSKR